MKIFFHTGLDGHCSGAILSRRYPEAEMIAYNYFYDNARSLDKIGKDEEVIFADVMPIKENLLGVLNKTKNVVLLDHHASSLRDLRELGIELAGKQTEDGIGACVLVWQYCYPELAVPDGVRWIGEYDAWERNSSNIAFNYGIKSHFTFPSSKIWDDVLSGDPTTVSRIIDSGTHVMFYLRSWYKRVVRSYSITGTVDGHSAILINQGAVDSAIFDQAEGAFDIYIRAVFGKGAKWLISITTNRDDLDVSRIANKYDGGGHAKSSGFAVKSLDEFFIMDPER